MLHTIHTKKIFRGNLLLTAMVLIMFLLNFYSKTMFYRPRAMHQWRQSDCLSIAKNYYEEGMNFFQPKIHFQGVKDGKAVSEFPILNYTAAALWKVFGEHEFIYRLLEYLIFLVAIFTLFNTVLVLGGSITWGLFCCGLLLTSPLLAYYSLNFIADVPAFSIGLMGLCCFIRSYYSGRQGLFYWSVFLGTLAVLMKASALTGLGVLLFVAFLDLSGLNRFFGTRSFLRSKSRGFLAMLVSLVTIVGWYSYALYYNNHHTNNIFLLTVLPIWEMTDQELFTNMRMLFNVFFPYFLNRPMLFLFYSLVIFVLMNLRQLEPLMRMAFVLSFAYFLLYLVFFFQVFNEHDYYLSNLMIFPVVTFICASLILNGRGFLHTNRRFINVFLTVVFLFNAVHCAAMYRIRMVDDDKIVHWYPFISQDEKTLGKYTHWYYKKNVRNVENFTPTLRSLGIKRDDLVLSLPDNSFNISLYMMDQKGYTIAEDHFVHDTTVTDRFFNRNIRYVIMNDTAMKREISYRRMAPKIESMGIFDRVEVFRVK